MMRKIKSGLLLFRHSDPTYILPLIHLLTWHAYFYLMRLLKKTPTALRQLEAKHQTISLDHTRFNVQAIPVDLGFLIECFIHKGYETIPGFTPHEGDICLDIGANIGACALSWAKLNCSGSIYCFEPHPDTVKRLQTNIQINECSNIHVYSTALSAEEGTMAMYGHTGSSMCSAGTPNKTSTFSIQTQTLDAFCAHKHITHIDLCKIDVEGHEIEVLQGAQNIQPHIRKLIVEGHSPELTNAVIDILKDQFDLIHRKDGYCSLMFWQRKS